MTSEHMTLDQFIAWNSRAPEWQNDDFREACNDPDGPDVRLPLMCWLRDFRDFTSADAELFDAYGGGSFCIRE